ncbi:MAG TPA: hypothetical protein VD993_18755 [Chitinophagaceae bacterium]|nr:hypothetical protein [Chitinophagaceae bacterium]
MLNLTIEEIKNKIIEGNKLALKRLIEKKKRENSFLIFSDNGKIVKVAARDIE